MGIMFKVSSLYENGYKVGVRYFWGYKNLIDGKGVKCCNRADRIKNGYKNGYKDGLNRLNKSGLNIKNGSNNIIISSLWVMGMLRQAMIYIRCIRCIRDIRLASNGKMVLAE